MSIIYISTLKNSPPMYEFREEITKKDIRINAFAIYTDSVYLKKFVEQFNNIFEHLSGIMVTCGNQFLVTSMAPRLWHLEIEEERLPSLPDIMELFMQVIFALREEYKRNMLLHSESVRANIQQKRLSAFYLAAQEKLRNDLKVQSKWTSAALTKLIRFAAYELQAVELKLFLSITVDFLLDDFFEFETVAILHLTKHGTWDPICWKGKEVPRTDFGPIMNFQSTYFENHWLYVPIVLAGETELLAITSKNERSRFPEYEISFLNLFSSLLSSTYGLRTSEEKLSRAKNAAESATHAKSEFLANMSHEIRTPLNGVMGMLQLLQTTVLSKEQKEYVDTALMSCHGLLNVIADILDFSKIEAGKIEITDEVFNLNELLESLIRIFRDDTGKKGLELCYNIDDHIPNLLVGDSNRLRQILINLIGNAVKYSDKGRIHIRVSPGQSMREVECISMIFCVSDTGIGIPENRIDSIFEPFSQVDGSYTRKYQGTGLGLSIVKRLIELMNGTVSIKSTLGKGTDVCFSLKFKLPEVCLQEKNTKEERSFINPIVLEENKRSFKIILAEDNLVNQKMVKRFLEKTGYLITAVETGKGVLECMADDVYDLILMDVQMPGMDGIETTRSIRKSPPGKNAADIPIIALTAHAMKGDKEKFLVVGMNDYISKPVNMNELYAMISRILGG